MHVVANIFEYVTSMSHLASQVAPLVEEVLQSTLIKDTSLHLKFSSSLTKNFVEHYLSWEGDDMC